MKLTRKIRMSAIGTALLAFAGAASAQTYDDVWVHGNACVGGGAIPSAYGANNPSTASSATVTCPIQWARPQGASNGQQLYWIQVNYWNRSTTAGAFSCHVYGLDEQGNKVFDPATTVFPAGSANSAPHTVNIGQPPITAKFMSVTCTIPKASGAAGGSSFLGGVAMRVGS